MKSRHRGSLGSPCGAGSAGPCSPRAGPPLWRPWDSPDPPWPQTCLLEPISWPPTHPPTPPPLCHPECLLLIDSRPTFHGKPSLTASPGNCHTVSECGGGPCSMSLTVKPTPLEPWAGDITVCPETERETGRQRDRGTETGRLNERQRGRDGQRQRQGDRMRDGEAETERET